MRSPWLIWLGMVLSVPSAVMALLLSGFRKYREYLGRGTVPEVALFVFRAWPVSWLVGGMWILLSTVYGPGSLFLIGSPHWLPAAFDPDVDRW